MEFKDLGISEISLKAVRARGFEKPTEIQVEVIPKFLEGKRDIVGQAQTGSGKTAAFALPLLDLVDEKSRNVQAIILTPTRELALQIKEEIVSLKGNRKTHVFAFYGGQPIAPQIERLKKGVQIVVGTPGRVYDHLRRGTLSLDEVRYFVLDEADRMLDMGFIDDIEKILGHTGSEKRILMFSATMPPEILMLARKYMRDFEVVRVHSRMTPESVDHRYLKVDPEKKFDYLCRILDEKGFYGIVFCQTKRESRDLAKRLRSRGYRADALNGDIPQKRREQILRKFREGYINVLISTDVVARGIDVKDLTHVINYSIPHDPETYVHRTGRTGREGKKGEAITFIAPWESRKLERIERMTRIKVRTLSN